MLCISHIAHRLNTYGTIITITILSEQEMYKALLHTDERSICTHFGLHAHRKYSSKPQSVCRRR